MKVNTRILPIPLVFVLAFGPSILLARGSGKVIGKITGKEGQELLGAVITIFKQDSNGGTISFTRSDRHGAYSLADLAPGSYYLQVSREGFQPVTNSNVRIEAGKTATVNVVLQEFIDVITGTPDPRNWDLKSVLRGTSDRRFIFRDLPGPQATPVDPDTPFSRGGALSVASSTGLGSDNYAVFPSDGQNGVASNFAYVEPVSYRGRMIFSGQVSNGYDSFWQVRNTYNYRPDPDRDFKISVGYGRLTFNGSGIGNITHPLQLIPQDPTQRESGVQTLGLGFEAHNKVTDALSFEYGFDLSRVYYGSVRSFVSPYFQAIITPADTWVLRTTTASRRLSDNNSLLLPDGEVLNLMEPTYISKIDGDVRVSQFKHSEIALAKTLPDESTVEVAVYEDRMQGPGLPFLVTSVSPSSSAQSLVQLRQDQTAQRGMRLAMNRRIIEYLNGSIAYVYGTATSLGSIDDGVTSEALAASLLNYMQRSYYHSVTGQLNATFPRTHTHMTAVVRWYPGQALTPIDLFADKTDMLTKGVNFSIRQPIPLPDFMGSTGRWEALVDVRNLFDQGRDFVQTPDGGIVLTRNPRALRFGINLNLY